MRWTLADRPVYHQGVPTSSARDRILDAAFRLFYARGIRGVGVDLIIAESGVAKATFYTHFPAKDELVLAYLDKVDGVWTGQLHAAAEAAGPDAADQLVKLEARLTDESHRLEQEFGAAWEQSDLARGRAIVQKMQFFRRLREDVAHRLEQADG